jgi:hypothetical protein
LTYLLLHSQQCVWPLYSTVDRVILSLLWILFLGHENRFDPAGHLAGRKATGGRQQKRETDNFANHSVYEKAPTINLRGPIRILRSSIHLVQKPITAGEKRSQRSTSRTTSELASQAGDLILCPCQRAYRPLGLVRLRASNWLNLLREQQGHSGKVHTKLFQVCYSAQVSFFRKMRKHETQKAGRRGGSKCA